jgi:hypothetical protein
MKSLYHNNIRLLLKIYTIIALIVAAVLAPPALSFAPVLLLVWYLFQWRRPISAFVGFMTQYFLFFALGLLFAIPVGSYFAWLISLPLLLAINQSFIDMGRLVRPEDSRHRRRPTNLCVVVISITLAMLFVSIIIGNLNLLLACGTVIIYFVTTGVIIWRKLPLHPIGEEPVQLRVVAGREGQTNITLVNKAKLSGTLFIESPYDWFKVTPNTFIPLKGDRLILRVSVTPTLSGPAAVKLKGYVVDPWGLTQVQFEIEPVKLVVIPRARYAEWLARKYLSGTKPGMLPLISNISSTKPLYGLRRGIEYYGNKMYQPGDSLKNIDRKHSVKYNVLVSKEFSDIQAQPAIILINLVAGNTEEMDKLVYNIIVTAMNLAQDSIPAAMAVYHDEDILLTTRSLASNNLVTSALQIVKNIVIKPALLKYLTPPDVIRLRANISRLSQTESQPAKTLRELLRLEYKNLSNNASSNPCTRALTEVMAKTNQQSTVIAISNRNYDAEALAFITYSLAAKGNALISV